MHAIPKRKLGRTGRDVTCVGLGGEGILRSFGQDALAGAVLKEAFSQGILYYDSAHAYSGCEGYYGTFWSGHNESRTGIFQAGKSAARDYSGAMAELSETIRKMGIGYLDLWQIHDVRTFEDIRKIEGKGGALSAFIEARETGLVRNIGVTGHHTPQVITHAVTNWPIDTVLIPVNPVEAVLGGFLDSTTETAREQGVGIIGMKVLGAGGLLFPDAGLLPEILMRYALSQDVDLIIVGCSDPAEVRALAHMGRAFERMKDEEMAYLVDQFRPYASLLAYYRGTE